MSMKKERASSVSEEGEGRPMRTTLMLTEKLSFALDCYAFESHIPKGVIVRTALREYLMTKGWDPQRIPTVLERLKRVETQMEERCE
jgi:hypothetical protein